MKTDKKAYQSHLYSGPRKSRKRVIAGLKRFTNGTSRVAVWRSNEINRIPKSLNQNDDSTNLPRAPKRRSKAKNSMPKSLNQNDDSTNLPAAIPKVLRVYSNKNRSERSKQEKQINNSTPPKPLNYEDEDFCKDELSTKIITCLIKYQSDVKKVENLDDTKKNNIVVPAEPAPVKQRTEISYEGLSLTELQRKAEQMQKEALAHIEAQTRTSTSSECIGEFTEECEEVPIPIETVKINVGEGHVVFEEEIENYEYEE